MKIRWFGHSCFGLTASDETRILTDPFDESVGYLLPRMEAAVVTVSHGHFDHAYTTACRAIPACCGKPGTIRPARWKSGPSGPSTTPAAGASGGEI